jgi:glycosyltransferase involved in cell wall biosynthesis
MKISFLTATYNRSSEIKRLYDSICRQGDNFNCQWIIIDDGSIDNTQDLIDSLVPPSNIDINYYHKVNSGKQSSINFGLKFIKYPITCIIDSDDYLDDDCLNELNDDITNYSFFDNQQLSTIIYNSRDNNGKLIGTPFPYNVFIGKPFIYYNKFNIKGDKFDFFKSDILKDYRFPIIEGEKFIAESVLWNKIHSDYNALFINKNLQVVEYIHNGLTNNALNLRLCNPKGAILVNYQGLMLKTTFKRRFRYFCNYFRYKLHSRKWSYCSLPFTSSIFLYSIVSFPLACILFLVDNYKIKYV